MRLMPVSRPSSALSSSAAVVPTPDSAGPGLAVRGALAALRAYKILLSPLFAGSCRYLPSCSDYTAEAITRYGVLRGSWMGARRIGRCHPFGGSGLDPVK